MNTKQALAEYAADLAYALIPFTSIQLEAFSHDFCKRHDLIPRKFYAELREVLDISGPVFTGMVQLGKAQTLEDLGLADLDLDLRAAADHHMREQDLETRQDLGMVPKPEVDNLDGLRAQVEPGPNWVTESEPNPDHDAELEADGLESCPNYTKGEEPGEATRASPGLFTNTILIILALLVIVVMTFAGWVEGELAETITSTSITMIYAALGYMLGQPRRNRLHAAERRTASAELELAEAAQTWREVAADQANKIDELHGELDDLRADDEAIEAAISGLPET